MPTARTASFRLVAVSQQPPNLANDQFPDRMPRAAIERQAAFDQWLAIRIEECGGQFRAAQIQPDDGLLQSRLIVWRLAFTNKRTLTASYPASSRIFRISAR